MKKLRERQVSLRMALTMCAAAGAITAVICLISKFIRPLLRPFCR